MCGVLIFEENMKAYNASQRIGQGGGEFESSGSAQANNPYELLDKAFAPIDLSDLENGAELTHLMNEPKTPICIAMTQEEARSIVKDGPDIRHTDMFRWLDSLDEDTLVVLEPYGHDLKPDKRNNEYLPDLAESGKDFPEIENSNTYPNMFGKSKGEITKITPIHNHFDAILKKVHTLDD